jgi:hypothetical protein
LDSIDELKVSPFNPTLILPLWLLPELDNDILVTGSDVGTVSHGSIIVLSWPLEEYIGTACKEGLVQEAVVTDIDGRNTADENGSAYLRRLLVSPGGSTPRFMLVEIATVAAFAAPCVVTFAAAVVMVVVGVATVWQ